MPSSSAPSADRPLILDGGTGSELRRRGVELSDICWSAEANLHHRELLAEIHRDYVRAGADIVTANTFATTRFVLAGAGLDDRFEVINRSAIEAAREAAGMADRPVGVAASMSCLTPGFEPGRYPPPDDEYRAYAEMAVCFAEYEVDLVLLEMLQDPAHAVSACRAAAASGLPFWTGLSCRLEAGTGRLVAFDDPAKAFAAVVDAVLPFAPAGVAIMHSPIEAIGPALEFLGEHWTGATGAWAEIGYPEDPDTPGARPIPAKDYAEAASTWLEQGVSLLGGCCGTTPAHIAALRALVDG